MPSPPSEVSSESAVPPSEKRTPRQSEPGNPGKRSFRILLIAAVAIVLIVAVLLVAFREGTSSGEKAAQSSSVATHTAATLRLKGTTEAVRMRAILAPVLAGQFVATLTITKLVAAGTRVKRGDPLAEFDRQSQIRDSIDKQAEYDKLVGQVSEERAKEDAARAKDETEIKQAESSLSKARLEMQKIEMLLQAGTGGIEPVAGPDQLSDRRSGC